MFDIGVIDGRIVKRQAHRVSFEQFVGPLIDGLTIDHIKDVCSSRLCVRPDHLRQVTVRVNVLAGDTLAAANLAKTQCVNGHEFTPGNIYAPPKRPRSRYCRKCRDEASARHRARRSRSKKGSGSFG
jgi:hypothetical protein